MDSIKRRLGRLSPARTHEPPQVAEERGHGDHWGCILRASDTGELLGFLGKVANEVENPIVFGTPSGAPGVVACSPDDPLRACVLMVNGRLATAYPEALGGPLWPVTVREVIPWANGIEGQIKGECHGAEVSFFDTRFYANKRKYHSGETYDFRMSALAYTMEPAPDLEVETDIGAKVSLKGASAYMPATAGNESADIDDYWFHSPLEEEPRTVQVVGRTLQIYPVTLALPEEFEMRVNLYAARHILRPGMDRVAPGDDLEGFLWLQGYMGESR